MGGGRGWIIQTCYMFSLKEQAYLRQLHNELLEQRYEAQALLRLDIPKPGTAKKRMLLIPTVRDRVVQSAAAIVLRPLFEAELEACTFAYRPGLSHLDAIETLRQLRDEGYHWVVDADITKYFDNVDHDLLFARFRELVPDPGVEGLIRQWVTADMVHGYRRVSRTKGLPQGAVVSPMLANLFLDRFDEALMREGFRLVRFADDFVIVCKSRPRAEAALELTESLLHELNLTLHPDKTRLTTFDDGFRFLGSLFIRSLILPTKQRGSTEVTSKRPAAPLPEARPVAKALPVQETPPPETSSAPKASLNPWRLHHRRCGRSCPTGPRSKPLPWGVPSCRPSTPKDSPLLTSWPNWAMDAQPPPVSSLLSRRGVGNRWEITQLLRSGVAPFLRTLYIHEQGSWLKLSRGRFVVTAGRDPEMVLVSVPTVKVQQIMIYGQGLITPAAMRHCLLNHITITLHSSRGRYYGKIDDGLNVDITRERRQFLYSMDADYALDLAKRFVRGKVVNSRRLLRVLGSRRQSAAILSAAKKLKRLLRKIETAPNIDVLRGFEGSASAVFFRALPELLSESPFTFQKRLRRPPPDPVNALLSFGYTLLFNNVHSMLCVHRLQPYVGFLHAEKPGHPALASDMVEEFRFLIDRMVIGLCNRNILSLEDFETPDTGFDAEPGKDKVLSYCQWTENVSACLRTINASQGPSCSRGPEVNLSAMHRCSGPDAG